MLDPTRGNASSSGLASDLAMASRRPVSQDEHGVGKPQPEPIPYLPRDPCTALRKLLDIMIHEVLPSDRKAAVAFLKHYWGVEV